MAHESISQAKHTSPKTLLRLIQRARDYLRGNEVFRDMCRDHGVDVSVIDLVPMRFGDLPVSARTERGVITFNYRLLDGGDFLKSSHYMLHEMEHYLAQVYGDRPTPGAAEGDYLQNPAEQDAFQRQIEFIDDTMGGGSAESYVDQLLDHHDKDGEDRNELREVLTERIQ